MRITGGLYRSRALASPRGDGTRPTADRVREALFSMLGTRVELAGARVLDLYAGTGALGLEALSRGADSVVFVERDRNALRALASNIEALAVGGRTTVIPRPVGTVVATLAELFDLVLVDPPYADVQSGAAATALGPVATYLAPAGLLVVEHASKTAAPAFFPLRLHLTRRYGDTALSLYGHGDGGDEAEAG